MLSLRILIECSIVYFFNVYVYNYAEEDKIVCQGQSHTILKMVLFLLLDIFLRLAKEGIVNFRLSLLSRVVLVWFETLTQNVIDLVQ